MTRRALLTLAFTGWSSPTARARRRTAFNHNP